VLSDLGYLLQISGLKMGLVRAVYVSRRKTNLRQQLLRRLSREKMVFCQTYKLGRALEVVTTRLVFDDTVLNLRNMNKNNLYELMWTLVFCNSVTPQSRKKLKGIVTDEYPTFKYDE
jgi:hypothetical protein